jgi:branched-chain amino acid aminotransferase
LKEKEMNIENRAQRKSPASPLNPFQLEFGKNYTPNWFAAEYKSGAWRNARVEPLSMLSLHPGAIMLHYAQGIFEGLKGYLHKDGKVAFFRPEMNARRMNVSAERMDMPAVPEDLFLDAINELVDTERDWVPPEPGSLYVRPTMVATEPYIGVRGATEFLFYVLTLPTGAYFRESKGLEQTVRVLVTQTVGRAAEGGTGGVKAAANYAITLKITNQAKARGCAQVLFLDARGKGLIEELGGMNALFVIDGKLVTPPVSGTTLAGITRDSVLHLARQQGLTVEERPLELKEVLDGIASGRCTEAMACGTAAVIAVMGSLMLEDGAVIQVGDGKAGPVAHQLYNELVGIQFGHRPDRHGWIQTVGSRAAAR